MSEVQVFNAPQGSILRTVIKDGEPWFVASDVCQILDIGNASLAVNGRADREDGGIDTDDRGIATVNTPSGEQQMLIVSEFGFYSLVFKSRKPEAKKFKRWVTHEVIPSIRKTGSYTAAPAFQVPQTLSEALRLAADLSDKVEAQAAQIEHQKPAVAFVEALVDTTSLTTLSDAAKEFGYGPKEFTAILVGRKILFRRTKPGPLIARQEHLDAGRFAVKVWMGNGYTKPNTHLTAKGLVWLKGIIPTATTDNFWDLEA